MNVLRRSIGITLKARCMRYQGLYLQYRLRAIGGHCGTRYKVEVILNREERASATVTSDIETVLKLFENICKGKVTPCTLSEIVREMRMGDRLQKINS